VREEKANNPRLKTTISETEFVAVMEGLNLPYPQRIHEALPANLACGLVAEDVDRKINHNEIKKLSAKCLDQFSGGLILDVRSPDEFHGELGHLPDALLTPLSELATYAKTWARDVPVLLVCQSGKRSRQGCSILSEMGFSNVTNLAGGMNAWRVQQEGLR
jgi:rhodanese-related sulfurtransferase